MDRRRDRPAMFHQLGREGQRVRIAEDVFDHEIERIDKELYKIDPLINMNPDPEPCLHRKRYQNPMNNIWFCPECECSLKVENLRLVVVPDG